MLRYRFQKVFTLVALVFAGAMLAGCSLTDNDVVELDFRGEWKLFAQHQKEPELNIRYSFTLTENENHGFTASARQYLLDMPIGDDPVIVVGRIAFDGNNIRIEFDYPDSGNGPEIAIATFARKSLSSSLVVVTGTSYKGESVGILLPRGGINSYDTPILIVEQVSQQ